MQSGAAKLFAPSEPFQIFKLIIRQLQLLTFATNFEYNPNVRITDQFHFTEPPPRSHKCGTRRQNWATSALHGAELSRILPAIPRTSVFPATLTWPRSLLLDPTEHCS